MPKIKIFISSVQREFAKERRMITDYITNDALLGKFFEVFIFENIAAQDRKPYDVYIDEVNKSEIYIGLFGKQYGFLLENGISPTECEFDAATFCNKYRIIFLLNSKESERHPKMNLLINKASDCLVYGSFPVNISLKFSLISSYFGSSTAIALMLFLFLFWKILE